MVETLVCRASCPESPSVVGYIPVIPTYSYHACALTFVFPCTYPRPSFYLSSPALTPPFFSQSSCPRLHFKDMCATMCSVHVCEQGHFISALSLLMFYTHAH